MRTIALLINPPPLVTSPSYTRNSPLLLPVRRDLILTNFRNPYKILTSFFSQKPFPSLIRMEIEAPSPPSVHVKEKIDLTDKERQIFDRLLHVVRHFNLQTQLRVAGGWVRDKLLGKECHDIDIALDNMLGREFCEKVNDFLISAGEETKGFAVIQRNPDQSKHLETARMHLFDIEIDFVNLRSEDYNENSRIPTMKFGTAEEDAYRRDLTINSLFYNINSSSVEDFTGRGLADLKSGRIVTPLPPKETFLDDPLRVLRAIRFGARFQFILDTELKKAASCDDVKTAIANKISRERIGQEIDLMIKGNHPVRAMTHIYDLSLFWVAFCLPTEFEPPTPVGCDRLCITYMGAARDLMQLITSYALNDGERRLLLYSALLLPLRDTTYKDKKAKVIPVVDYIFRNSLKLTAGDIKAITQIHSGSAKFVSLIPYIISDESVENVEVFWKSEIIDVPVSSKLRVYAGLLLSDVKGLWRVALIISVLLYPTKPDGAGNILDNQFELDKRKDLFTSVENVITELDLEEVAEDKLKPLVNGKDIMNALELKFASPVVGEWHQKLHQWQLAHPLGSREECLDWLKDNYSKRVKRE